MSKGNRRQILLLREQLDIEKGLTKEEKIALHKAKVAKFHPEPDFLKPSAKLTKERQKMKHERNMLERAKKIWHSIVSVPMGGISKK